MLSKSYAPLPVFAKVYNERPGNVFETSLFYPENISPLLLLELEAEKETSGALLSRLLITNQLTIAAKKEKAYKEFLSQLDPKNMLWDEILLFAAGVRKSSAEYEDLFTALQQYPGALNMHLFQGSNGELYNQAIKQFNNNQADSALIAIQESINFNGVTKEKIGLTTALFRMQENYEQSLLFSCLLAFSGIETNYLPGNLYLALKNLGFKHTEELKQHLLTDVQCDTWSLDILNNQ